MNPHQTPKSEMVERVARAIYASAGRLPPEPPWEDADQEVRDWISDHARAAIEAMREPSEAMIDSGVAFALNVSLGGDYRWTDYVRDKHRAMIDAALKPEGGET